MAQYIETDVDIAEYLSQVLEEGDVGELCCRAGVYRQSLWH